MAVAGVGSEWYCQQCGVMFRSPLLLRSHTLSCTSALAPAAAEHAVDQLAPPPLISHLMSENRSALDELMAMVRQDLDPDDPVRQDELFVLRFLLSSTSRDITKTAKRLRETVEWRKSRRGDHCDFHGYILGRGLGKMEAIYNHPKMLQLSQWWPGRHHNYTKYMEAVQVVRIGLMNVQAVWDAGLLSHVVLLMEVLKEQIYFILDHASRATGRLCKTIQIFDFSGAGWAQLHRKFGMAIGKELTKSELYYPQLLRANVVVNPPFIMSAFWSLAKVFAPTKLIEKTIFCGSTSDASKCPFLRGHFDDLRKLPSFLGGECVCTTNPIGLGECAIGVANSQTSPNKGSGMLPLNVPAGETHMEEVRMEGAGVIAYWCFEVEEHGIEFSVTFTSEVGGDVEAHPMKKYKAANGVVQGQYTSPSAGTLRLSFNNDYSTITSKDLKYFITVLN